MNHDEFSGRVPYAGFKTWYALTGSGDKTPLLTIHGGPGGGSDYLRSLDSLNQAGRQVIYYDQLGCGRSPADSNPSRWTIDFYVNELKNLIEALKLKSFHLLGQSWGGFLAVHYAAQNPAGLKSLILANVPIDHALWDAEGQRLAKALPSPHGEVLKRAIENKSEDDPAYKEAMAAFYQKHWVHGARPPQTEAGPGPECGRVMEGLIAFHTTGTLRGADASGLLPEIKAPALIIHGEYDQCTKALADKMLKGLPNARRVVTLKNSGHLPTLDAPEEFNRAVSEFLDEAERDSKGP